MSERQRGRGKSEEIRNGSNAILRNARWVSPMGGLRERERRNEGRRPERRGRESFGRRRGRGQRRAESVDGTKTIAEIGKWKA